MSIHTPTARLHALVAAVAFGCDALLWGLPALVFVVGFVGEARARPVIRALDAYHADR